ncbi:hypothetical protein Tco_0895820 [Tanacetum coccineum]|uniref:Reverse transcriptase domain-containing protein n=1 Tax=Tanacetum coccineum TaxID=301880 RepID=A0ABQ5CGS1_9ASTR
MSQLKDMVKALLLDKKNQSQAPAHQTPAPVKAVEESCVTCGGAHSYQNCPATDGNVYHDNIQAYVSQAAAANFNQGNTGARPPMVANQIRPPGFPPVQNNQGSNQNRYNQGNNYNQNRGNNYNQNRGNNFSQGPIYQPPSNQPPAYQAPAPQTQGVSKTDFDSYVKANDAVMRNMQNQNQGQNLQTQLNNLATSNQRLESMLGITTRSGVAYQGPTSSSSPKVMNRDTEVTKDTMLPTNNGSTKDVQPPVVQVQSHNPISEPVLADRSITEPIGIAKDVRLMVGKFQFPADFVVVDFEPDPPGKEAITFNLDQTSRYTANYNHMTANRIDVIKLASEEYSQEVLGFSDSAIDDEPISREIIATYYDPEGDILILEAFLNSKPLPPLPNHKDYSPEIRKELKVVEAKTVKSSIDEPPEVELKDLPPHLEYTFLEGDDKLHVIIAKDLKDEEKAALSSSKSNSEDIACPWVSPVHCVPKKGGITVVKNDDIDLIPTRWPRVESVH